MGPYAVHRAVLSDVAAGTGNPRIEAHAVFDKELEALRESLAGQGSGAATRFEAAVGRLLAFLGFVVNQLSGDSRLGEAVDVLAHSPAGNVLLAVECTTGALSSKGKLSKLVARVDALRRSVPTLQVLGAIVTSLTRTELAQVDLDSAARERLAVICREDLDELLAYALASARVNDVLAYVATRVPAERRAPLKTKV